MTNKVQKEETPNPYNANKPWHNEEDKPFTSSNEMYFEEPQNKLFDSNDITKVNAEGSVNTEELESKKDTPYKRPNYKKRYDDLKKHYDSKLNEFKTREQELLEEATKNRTSYKAPKSEEELEEFKNNYPDVYEVVETVAHMQSESKAKVLEERLSKLQERENKLVRQDAEQRLNEKHPDFEDIRNSDDFHTWAKEQPKSIQDWIYSNASDADLASRALDLFKKDFGIEPTKTKSNSKPTRQSAADMVSTKTITVEPKQEKVWSEREIAAMSMAEFDKYEKDISDAMQDGRISK
jgi:chemotaxis protein histidine kinase CheA